MKSLMKWATGFFVIGLIVLVSFHCPSNLKVSASNDGTIYMQAEALTEDTINKISNSSVRSQLEPGDVQVSFCIQDNPQFCNSGMGFYYDPVNFESIASSTDPQKLLQENGPAGDNLTIIVRERSDVNLIGIASNGGDLSTEDGIITSVFLRPKTSNPPINPVTGFFVDMLSRDPEHHFYPEEDPYVHVIVEYFTCGDLDDNGLINADDSNIITDALGDVAGTINASNYQQFFDDIPEFDVFDVDGDGDVDDDDAECILSYYVYVEIMGSDPVDCGNVGILIPHFVYVLI